MGKEIDRGEISPRDKLSYIYTSSSEQTEQLLSDGLQTHTLLHFSKRRMSNPHMLCNIL